MDDNIDIIREWKGRVILAATKPIRVGINPSVVGCFGGQAYHSRNS